MSVVHVAAGIILQHDRVLICKRLQHQHQGGLWEFPGGKLEQEESVEQALARELTEELAIQISESSHFMTVEHDYGDKAVVLHFHKVISFTGQPQARETQQMKWIPITDLALYEFPVANQPVVDALLTGASK